MDTYRTHSAFINYLFSDDCTKDSVYKHLIIGFYTNKDISYITEVTPWSGISASIIWSSAWFPEVITDTGLDESYTTYEEVLGEPASARIDECEYLETILDREIKNRQLNSTYSSSYSSADYLGSFSSSYDESEYYKWLIDQTDLNTSAPGVATVSSWTNSGEALVDYGVIAGVLTSSGEFVPLGTIIFGNPKMYDSRTINPDQMGLATLE